MIRWPMTRFRFSGLMVMLPGAWSMGCLSSLALGMTLGLVGCSTLSPKKSASLSENVSSASPAMQPVAWLWLNEQSPLRGPVPGERVRERLGKLGLPGVTLLREVSQFEAGTWAEHMDQLARLNRLEFRPGLGFRTLGASHSIEGPDSAGRPGSDAPILLERRLVHVSIRFESLGADGSVVPLGRIGVGASGQRVQFAGTVAAGVTASWGSTSERTVTEAAVSVDTGNSVTTGTKTVPAGVSYAGLVGFVPGSSGLMRIDGNVSVSSFLGAGIERAAVTCPLQLDIRRGEWISVMEFDSFDAQVRAAFKPLGVNFSAGVTSVRVSVKLEPC